MQSSSGLNPKLQREMSHPGPWGRIVRRKMSVHRLQHNEYCVFIGCELHASGLYGTAAKTISKNISGHTINNIMQMCSNLSVSTNDDV